MASIPCTQCDCTNFAPNVFHKARCNNCMHMHVSAGSTSVAHTSAAALAAATGLSDATGSGRVREIRRSFAEPSDTAAKPTGTSSPAARMPRATMASPFGASGGFTGLKPRPVVGTPTTAAAPASAAAAPPPTTPATPGDAGKKHAEPPAVVPPPGGTPARAAVQSVPASSGGTSAAPAAPAPAASARGAVTSAGRQNAQAPPPSRPQSVPTPPEKGSPAGAPADVGPASRERVPSTETSPASRPATTAMPPSDSSATMGAGAVPTDNAPDFETHFTSVAAVVQAIEAKKRARRAVLHSASADIQARYRDNVARIRGCVSAHSTVLVETLCEMLRANASELSALVARAHTALDRMPKGIVGTNALLRDMNHVFGNDRGSPFTERQDVVDFIEMRRENRLAQLTASQEVLARAFRLHATRMRAHGSALAEIATLIAAGVLQSRSTELVRIQARFSKALARVHTASKLAMSCFLGGVQIPSTRDVAVHASESILAALRRSGKDLQAAEIPPAPTSMSDVAAAFATLCAAREDVLLLARNVVARAYTRYRSRLGLRAAALADVFIAGILRVSECSDRELPSILERAKTIIALVPRDVPAYAERCFTSRLRAEHALAAEADVRTFAAAYDLVTAAIGSRMKRLDIAEARIRQAYNRWLDRVVARAVTAAVRIFKQLTQLVPARHQELPALLESLRTNIAAVPRVVRARIAFFTSLNTLLGLQAEATAIAAFRAGSLFAVLRTLETLRAVGGGVVPGDVLDAVLSSNARASTEAGSAPADADDPLLAVQDEPNTDAKGATPQASAVQLRSLLAAPAPDEHLRTIQQLLQLVEPDALPSSKAVLPLADTDGVLRAAARLGAHRLFRLHAAAARVQSYYRAYHRALGAMSAAYASLVAGTMRDLDRALDRELEALAERAVLAITKVSAGQSKRLREAYFLTELNKLLHADAALPTPVSNKYGRVFREAYRAALRECVESPASSGTAGSAAPN